MIIALAGRRVDSPDAKKKRFPLENVAAVRGRVNALFKECGATGVVASAACGADLIALSEARQLGLRCRVVLPFERVRFRETSVTDRPGEWGVLYDEVLDGVEAAGDLVVLKNVPADEAYAAANGAIVLEALALAQSVCQAAIAVLVWDGASRGEDDLTEQFRDRARQCGLDVREVLTL